MRSRRITRSLAAGLCLWGATALWAQTNQPPAALAGALRDAEASRARMQKTMEQLAALESRAQVTNQEAQADCLRGRLVKLKGLLEVVSTAIDRLRVAENDREVETASLNVQFSAVRAEKLRDEAMGCLENTVAPSREPSPAKVVPPKLLPKMQYRPRPVSAARSPVVRDRNNCITQGRLACLFVQAMELNPGTKDTATACQNELSQRAIEPLDGWQSLQCATVDDVYVVAARVLNLRVANPADPLSYGQALRDAGLPVDALLPARVAGAAAPVLVEDEVRAFLKHGYAPPRMW
jgi:hypothetical protein